MLRHCCTYNEGFYLFYIYILIICMQYYFIVLLRKVMCFVIKQ